MLSKEALDYIHRDHMITTFTVIKQRPRSKKWSSYSEGCGFESRLMLEGSFVKDFWCLVNFLIASND